MNFIEDGHICRPQILAYIFLFFILLYFILILLDFDFISLDFAFLVYFLLFLLEKVFDHFLWGFQG